MKKFYFTFFLSLCYFFSLSAFSNESFHHVQFVFPKYVKNSRGFHSVSTSDKIVTKRAAIVPKIHQGIWPHFCPKHLIEDPAGCSSWSESNKGKLQLDFALDGTGEAYFDPELSQRILPYFHLIPKSSHKLCDYAWCPECKQTVVRGISSYEDDDDDDDSDATIYFIVYKCKCTGSWWLDLENLEDEDYDIYASWNFCQAPTIFPDYIEWHHKSYFRFLKRHFSYIEENSSCDCFWPQIEPKAKEISDLIYLRLTKELQTSKLDEIRASFSALLAERTIHGFLSGLFTHAFFYSDYHSILADFDQHCYKNLSASYPDLHTRFIRIEEEIQSPFLSLYNQCLQKHPHPKIYYERGMVFFHRGENLDSLEDIRRFISHAEKHNYQELLNSDLYLNEGRLLNESLSYDEAIVSLTKAIAKDRKNFDAYFERAVAYFEVGDFQKALSDYLASNIRPKKVNPKVVETLNAIKFGQGMTLGLLKGGKDAAFEFVPSLLSSFRGIGRGIWVFASHPITVSQDMVNCANACLEFVKETTTKELICKLVPELQESLKKWDSFDDITKGETIGFMIGKYGTDIFIGTGSIKAVHLYRDLRRANALMTLETAAVSHKNAKEIIAQAAKEWQTRQTVLKNGNLKIHWDKQGKHVPGHKNYSPFENRSILTHNDPQKLINQYAGTGRKVGERIPGKPGYKEIVDFEEPIGFFVDKETGNNFVTTRGSIDYAKDGVHIVPRKPR